MPKKSEVPVETLHSILSQAHIDHDEWDDLGCNRREDFMKPLGLTANRLAAELFVPVPSGPGEVSTFSEQSNGGRASARAGL